MLRGVAWLCSYLLILGCGVNIKPKQVDQPCTRTTQCDTGLACEGGVCVPSSDGGVDDGTDAGG
ncbi:MAG TPA: hypothetical protein VFG22_09315 [Polyangiales bacterium]|nr:hypothetical protein [Polyangiales bacterium]